MILYLNLSELKDNCVQAITSLVSLISSEAQKGVDSIMAGKGNTYRSLGDRAARAILMLALVLALMGALMSCQGDDDASEASAVGAQTSTEAGAMEETSMSSKLSVVTTSNIAADWARNVGGDRVEVKGLLPVGTDPHSYQPGARDVADIAAADLVLTIGLGLEDEWLHDLVHNASADEQRIAMLGEMVSPIEFEEIHYGHAMEGEASGEILGRLLIADGSEPRVSILDLETGQLELHALDVAAASATLYSSPSKRFVYALSRGPEDNDDRVQIFDGGVYLEEHGDHFDLIEDDVSELTLGTTDQRPVHVAVHGGQVAIFHDASGRAALFDEHELQEDGNDYEPVWLEAGLQHGAVVPLDEEYAVVTSNNPDYPDTATSSLPIGVEVRTLDDTVVYDASNRACPGLHGEAANHHGVMFGCTGGVLYIEGHDGDFEHVFIPNDSSMNEAARIGTVWAHEDAETFFGSASYRIEGVRLNGGLWAIDAEGESMTQVLPATDEKRVLRAAFDAHGERAFFLTYDGTLNAVDMESGDLVESIELLEPFDGDTSPNFTTVGDLLYLTDRANGRVIEFNLDHGEVEREWAVAGEPRSVAFAGIGGSEADEEHGHGEDAHDDHDHGVYDPHFWFDPQRAKTAVYGIAERLGALDPEGAATYKANADAYAVELDTLHAWTQGMVSAVPAERRVLVTSHDSLGYFAELYGFEVVGTVLPGLSPDVEPSALHIRRLMQTLEEHNVPVVFGETTVSERLAQSVASENSARFQRLYSGSLGSAGSGAETYLGMVRANVGIIVGALR